jgi:predicted PurR-regulated permease PerM
VIIPVFIFAFLAIKQGVIIAQALLNNEDFSADGIFKEISHWEIFDRIFSAPKDGKRQIQEWLQDIGTMGVAGFISVIGEVPNVLLQLTLTIISFFYFLIDGPRFISWIYDRIPFDSLARTKMEKTFSDTTISVIWANLAASTVQASLMGAAFLILGVPAAFLATATTFVLAWIPILGSTPVWIAGALFLFTQGSLIKVVLMLLFGIITSVADNIVRPLVLKGRANMHPLLSLVAIFGGISMFGILGVFIGPVIAAILSAFLQILPIMEQRAESLPGAQ